MKDAPIVQDENASTYAKQVSEYEQLDSALSSGFTIAGPVYANEPEPLKRGAFRTVQASLSQGLTASIFGGFSIDPQSPIDLDFDVTSIMRPGDEQYAAQFYRMPNAQVAQDFQKYLDAKKESQQIMAARPGVSFAAQILDPTQLAVDIGTWGLGHAVTLPLLAAAANRTHTAMTAAQMIAKYPRSSNAIIEAFVGAESGGASMFIQTEGKALTDLAETEENIGENIAMGLFIGGALGGAVGLIGRQSVNRLSNKFAESNRIVGEAASIPNDFVGPPKPAEEGVLSTGKKPDIRAQEAEKPKLTLEQLKAEAENLKLRVDAEEPVRREGYAKLKADFMQLLENAGENAHPLVKKALSLVTWPIRNLSAANRLLNSPFGTARMYVMGMVRNATEFVGTRNGMVLPRSAQNRIEDINNQYVSALLDINEMFLEANKIKGGPFAHERRLLGEKLYDEDAFYSDIGEQILHVGKATELTNNANPVVQKAAKHVYDKLYKPFGKLLKEYNLIKDADNVEEVLNYLNRHWMTDKILANPEGFKKWLANFFDEQNQKLKALLPAYEQEHKVARELTRDANRFERAADKIDKLKESIEKNKIDEKIKDVEAESAVEIENINKQHDERVQNIEDKYKKLNPENESEIPDISATKKILKDEINVAITERDKIINESKSEEASVRETIATIRAKFKEFKDKVLLGKKDKAIKRFMYEQDAFKLLDNPEYNSFNLDELSAQYDILFSELDDVSKRLLRKDFISSEQDKAIDKIAGQKERLRAIKEERKKILGVNKTNLNKDLTKAASLLEAESKLSGRISKRDRIKRLLDIRKKLELKLLDLKKSHKIYKIEALKEKQIAKLQEPLAELDYMQRKYSRSGLEAFYTRKAAERLSPQFIKQARAAERKTLKNSEPIDEARIIAEELNEGAALARERAEEIIPWDLRSNKTGKPRRTYDPELEPAYSYNMAERTMFTMMGQEDEIIMNPVLGKLGGGKPGMFKPRDVKMADNYPGIEQWVQRDIRFLMHNFATGIAPPIALHELMLQLNQIPLVRQTVKRMQVENKNIGARKAVNMPDEMANYNEIPGVMATMLQEEFRFASEGLSGKPLEDLLVQLKNAQQEMTELDKIIRGVNGNGLNLNAKNMSDFMDLFNSATSTVTTTNIVISMMSELMTPAIRYGFNKYITKSLAPLLASSELRSMSMKEAKGFHVVLNRAKGAIIKNKITGQPGSMKNSTLGRFFSNLSNRLQSITGANGMQDMTELAAVILSKGNLLEMAEKVALGTITEKELTHLAQRSLSPAQAKSIHKLWKKYGHDIDGVKGIDPEILENMSPNEARAFHDYSAYVNDELKTIIVKPGAGSMPDLSYTPWGRAIMYLKKYFFAFTNDILVPGLQRADAESAQGFMGLFAMGALQSELRRIYRGEERKEFNLEGFIAEALTNSALPGIYTFGIDLSIASGIIQGSGGARYDPSGGVASLILGPGIVGKSGQTLAILSKLRKIGTDEDRQYTYKEFNQTANAYVPLYKWAPIAALLKPNIKEYAESIGRGGE